ncbi:beta-fructofuranosidase, insoluble isoenzyme CWINV1-like protein [Tanacetum coccineum]
MILSRATFRHLATSPTLTNIIRQSTDKYDVDIDFMDSRGSLQYDYGRFYHASKSFYDGDKKRRVLWSWINEGDSEPDDNKKRLVWSIWLSENGDQLVQWPVKELEKLRKRKVHYENKELNGGSLFQISGITASQEVICT